MEDHQHTAHLPVYNIKAVSRLVGLLPVTLRAWERRYGLPQPQRGDQGYRLYSDYDLNTLRWIKIQLDAGLSISHAVQYLNELRIAGKDPAAHAPDLGAEPSVATPSLAQQFRQALEQFNDQSATEILRRAFTIHSVDTVLTEVIQPTLIELGESWHNGRLPIAVEHFATQFCMQHLHNLAASSSAPTRDGVMVAACAPGETHQVGLLSLLVMLRWRGWDVKYLGPDLKLDRMAEALIPLHPRMLLFTATLPETALNLTGLADLLAQFPNPKPIIVLGGQAFQKMRLSESVPAVYLNATPSSNVATIEKLMLDPKPRR